MSARLLKEIEDRAKKHDLLTLTVYARGHVFNGAKIKVDYRNGFLELAVSTPVKDGIETGLMLIDLDDIVAIQPRFNSAHP